LNVSKQADAEFKRLLETEDRERYARMMKNIRKDQPNVSMSEDQALANFMLGRPTGQWRFKIIAGKEPLPVIQLILPATSNFRQNPFRPATADRGGRPRKYKTNAQRQREHRRRNLVDIRQNAISATRIVTESAVYEGVS
jgi:hypothetical protein